MSAHASEPTPRDGSSRTSILGLVALVLTVGGAIGTCILERPRGEEVGTVALPGTLKLELAAGDQLAFRLDHEALVTKLGSLYRPDGCTVDFVLTPSHGRETRTHCDAFREASSSATADGTDDHRDIRTGLWWFKIDGQHVACRLATPAGGPATLRAETNLQTCLAEVRKATAHVFVEHPRK